MEKWYKIALILVVTMQMTIHLESQEYLFDFGEVIPLNSVLSGDEGAHAEPIKWFNVNTEKKTWELRDSILVNYGHPLGVVRSGRQFENYILHVEWMHIEPGGNSGIFMWSDAVPQKNRLPNGVEVQMLELDYVTLSPVLPTRSHPEAIGMGWVKFQQMIADYALPVFALGGMRIEYLELAWQHGAHGIALQREVWST